MESAGIWVAFGALIAGAYFAACTMALRVYSRARLADLLEVADRSDRLERFVDRQRDIALVCGLIRSVMSLVVLLGVLHSVQMRYEQWSALRADIVAFVIAVVLISVFCVAIPASWARYHPEKIIVRSLPLLHAVTSLAAPALFLMRLFDPLVRRLTGGEEDDRGDLEEHVMSVVEEHEEEGNVDEQQKAMIEAVFDLPGTTAGEIMTPRTDVDGIEVSASLDEVKEFLLEHRHSRLPVYEDTIDHVIGVLYTKDMIRFIKETEGFTVRDVMREPRMVPETKPIVELLTEFRAAKVHIAIVLDEYGGTAGLVTIEDIIEELVGEIQDEYEVDEEEPAIHRVDENTAEMDARIEIDVANGELGLNLPENEDYDTMGGFVFSTLGHIPEVGETVETDEARITVTEAENTRINRLRVELISSNSEAKSNGKHAGKNGAANGAA